MVLRLVAVTGLLAVSSVSRAQLSDSVRRQNAVVLYEFKEGSGTTINDTSTIGTPLNLQIGRTAGVVWNPTGGIEFAQNFISSTAPATKIYNACKASKEMSVEIWLENTATAELLSGQYPADIPQPLRILSYSSGLNKTNFALGQFYDDVAKNQYMMGVRTNNNTDAKAFLTNAVKTDANELILPSNDQDPAAERMQKVFFTLSKGQIASLYLSDRNGNMYLSKTTSNGFTTQDSTKYFDQWDANSHLVLGNEFLSNISQLNVNYEYRKCDRTLIATEPNCASPNRYWRGRVHLVAVYCKAFSKTEILGATATDIQSNPSFDVDIRAQMTPALKRAKDLHARLTGIKTPIGDPILNQMASMISAGNEMAAANLATQDARFYNITVRDFAAKLSNRDETIETPLNDFIATIIGSVRDNRNAKTLLTDNLVYQADPKKAAVPSDLVNDILKSNNHYAALSSGMYDLSQVLVPKKQQVFNGKVAVDNPTPAGLLTTRQWMAEHAVAGTNRRLVEYAFREFLCTPMQNMADATGPDNIVARDIDRFPGGSHSKYVSSCRACHTIMDGFRPAFSNFTFNGGYFMHALAVSAVARQDDENKGTGIYLSTAPSSNFVVSKINHNENVFPGGRVTVDSNWVNNAVYGSNQSTFAWTKAEGSGVRDFGQMIGESKQFQNCMAKRVFETICKREPVAVDDAMLKQAAQEFATSQSYNLRYLFEKIATSPQCLGVGL